MSHNQPIRWGSGGSLHSEASVARIVGSDAFIAPVQSQFDALS